MNAPTNWKHLAEMISEEPEKLEALVIVNSLWLINDVVVPAMMQGFPKETRYSFSTRKFTLPNGTLVRLQSVASSAGVDALRGVQVDLIFFDPHWQGKPEWMEEIRTVCRRPYARR